MLNNFWEINDPILVPFHENGQIVNSARYSDMLVNELKPAIRSKRRGLLSKTVLLLHNARPHTAAHTVDTLRALKFGVETSTIQSGLGAIGLSLVWTYERTFAGPEVCGWQRGNGGGAKLVKGHAKKLFSRGLPQACGQVDQVCCEAGGLCRKIRQKNFCKYSCKNIIIKFLLFNDLPSYIGGTGLCVYCFCQLLKD